MKHSDTIASAFNEIKAWKTACLCLSLVSCFFAAALVYSSSNAPSYLVPYEFATSKGRVKVEPRSMPQMDYLQVMAQADLGLLLNWQPNSVQNQIARFLNRLTPEMYAAQSVKLTQEANTSSRGGVSQSFYPATTQVNGYKVSISGSIIKWKGSDETARANITYIVSYVESNGFLRVDNVETK